MRKPILAANWKMNHGPTDARAFFRAFLAHTPRATDRTARVASLRRSMARAVESEDFERAAVLRDQIRRAEAAE